MFIALMVRDFRLPAFPSIVNQLSATSSIVIDTSMAVDMGSLPAEADNQRARRASVKHYEAIPCMPTSDVDFEERPISVVQTRDIPMTRKSLV